MIRMIFKIYDVAHTCLPGGSLMIYEHMIDTHVFTG